MSDSKSGQNPQDFLRYANKNPMLEVRLMQINSVTSSAPLSYVKAPVASPAPAPGDQVSISLSPGTFSSLVQQANQTPEVRSDAVEAYKSRVQAGHYPAQDVIEGLINLMGGKWAAMAKAGGSSK